MSDAAVRQGAPEQHVSLPRFFHVTRQPAELVTAKVTGLTRQPAAVPGGIEPPKRCYGEQRPNHTMGSRYLSKTALFGPPSLAFVKFGTHVLEADSQPLL